MRANASHRADAAPCMRPCRAAMIRRVATAPVDEPTTATARLSDEDAPPVRARPVPPSSGRLEAAVRCDRRARDRRHRPLGTGTRMGGAIDRPDTARRGAGGRCVWRRPPPFRHARRGPLLRGPAPCGRATGRGVLGAARRRAGVGARSACASPPRPGGGRVDGIAGCNPRSSAFSAVPATIAEGGRSQRWTRRARPVILSAGRL